MGAGVPYVYEKLKQTVCCCWHMQSVMCYLYEHTVYTEVKSFPRCSEIMRTHPGLMIISVLGFCYFVFLLLSATALALQCV